MEKLTDREFRMRLSWLRSRWNEPSRSDYYLMQIADEVRHVLGGSRNPNALKLKFGTESKKVLSQEEKEKAIKATIKRALNRVSPRKARVPHGRRSRATKVGS